MCRSIKPLFNFDPPATDEEIHEAAAQFVRKITGFVKPSIANEQAFVTAVSEISDVIRKTVDTMETSARPKNREEEKKRAKERREKRFPQ